MKLGVEQLGGKIIDRVGQELVGLADCVDMALVGRWLPGTRVDFMKRIVEAAYIGENPAITARFALFLVPKEERIVIKRKVATGLNHHKQIKGAV